MKCNDIDRTNEDPAPKVNALMTLKPFLTTLVFIFCFKSFIAEAYQIPTSSMAPTIEPGDRIYVNKFVYGTGIFGFEGLLKWRDPDRGDVVVFRFPKEAALSHLAEQPEHARHCVDPVDHDFLKRVIGLPGDKVEVRQAQIYLNDEPLRRDFLGEREPSDKRQTRQFTERGHRTRYTTQHIGPGQDFGPVTVKPGHYFVMGDNRDNSADSRCWGQVPREFFKGRAMFIWWSEKSLSRIGSSLY